MCGGEVFQIYGEGDEIQSGRRVLFRYVSGANVWMGCPSNNRCDRRTCPGSLVDASDYVRCKGEIFRIYARGRKFGETIYNGDVVMLSIGGRYVSIQGQYEGDDTSLDFCPGLAPPSYLSYGTCSRNAFRIYRRPQ